MSGSELDERRLRRLLEAGRALVAELDLEALLRRLLEEARQLTGARYAALGILAEGREGLERFITLGIDDDTRARIGDLPRGRGVLGVLIDDPRPLRLTEVGRHPRSYGLPPGHPPMASFLGVPILIRGEVYGNLYLTEKEDGDFDETDEEATVILAEWAAIAIENARLYTRVEGRRQELERAVRGLEATTEIARAVGGETDLERVLETIVKRGRALVEARALLILLKAGEDLVVAATAGEFADDLRGAKISAADSALGQVLRSQVPERVVDVGSRLRVSVGELGVEAEAALVVPLAFRGQDLGVLIAFDRLADSPQFSTEHERLLLSFAASAATAVATAKSVAEDRLRQTITATEQERGRWARELHDQTLQGLGALRVLLSSARQRGGPKGLETAVEKAIDQLGSEIENLRVLVTELRPAALDEIGLEAAIRALVDRSSTVAGLRVETEIALVGGSGADLESTVYRLIQECLTNIAKHSRAENVRVRIVEDQMSVEVEIEDDGVGFDPDAATDGFGLVGMRERVELAGGRFELSSSPGTGTKVQARIPVPATGEQPPLEELRGSRS
jgi:signal transduction histidine kinase